MVGRRRRPEPPRRRTRRAGRPHRRPGVRARGRPGRRPPRLHATSRRSTAGRNSSERRHRPRRPRRRAALPLGPVHRGLRGVPRRGVGPPGPRRRRPLRAPQPGGLPVRSVLDHDPAPPPGLPRRLRRLPDRRRSPPSRTRTATASSPTRASSATAPRSTRQWPTRACWRSGRRASWTTFIWSYAPTPGPAPKTLGDVPAVTPESTALSKALKKRGLRFVGPTTAYALMQACGLVDDHLEACVARRAA